MVDEASRQEADMITKAHLAAERLEKANEVNKELVKRMESFEARQILGGKTSGGQPQEREITEEEKLKLNLKNYWEGSSVERYFK